MEYLHSSGGLSEDDELMAKIKQDDGANLLKTVETRQIPIENGNEVMKLFIIRPAGLGTSN